VTHRRWTTVDDWLSARFARDPSRYLYEWLTVGFALQALVIIPIVTLLPARYEGLSAGQTAIAMVVSELAGWALCSGAGVFVARRNIKLLFAWTRGTCAPGHIAGARAAAFAVPRRMWLACGIVGVLISAPTSSFALMLPRHHLAAVDVAEITIGGEVGVLFIAVFGYVVADLAMRPVRASFAEATDSPRELGLTARLLPVLLLITFLAATAGATWFARRGPTPSGHMLEAYGISLALTACCAAVLGPLLAGTVIGPVRDLISGTRAVAEGDLRVRVPITASDELGELTSSFNAMVADLGDRVSLRDHNAQLVSELRASSARIVAASHAARRAVERDLHDGAQQQLVLLRLKLSRARELLDANDPRGRAMLQQVDHDLVRALAELRDLAQGIYPTVLENEGLPAAMREAVNRTALPTTLACDGTGRFAPEIEAAVYFCCLEALQNASKHAGERARVTVDLAYGRGALMFAICDDGRGFDASAGPARGGLQNMADRIGAVGGTLELHSVPGQGTRVRGSVPARTAATHE
jgi:signal transduction histidine kinase